MLSLMPFTSTVLTVFQLELSQVRILEVTVVLLSEPSNIPSEVSRLLRDKVTLSVVSSGRSKATVKLAVPPSSLVLPLTALTV